LLRSPGRTPLSEFGGAPYVLGGIFIAISLAVFLLKVERPAAPVGEAELETA
jgi:hypothetical protein